MLAPAQFVDQVIELLETGDLQVEQHLGKVAGGAHHGQPANVHVVLGHDVGNVGQGAGLVDAGHRQGHGKPLVPFPLHVPAHVDPFAVLEALQRGVLHGVKRDALARAQDADDPIPGHRATGRKGDG